MPLLRPPSSFLTMREEDALIKANLAGDPVALKKLVNEVVLRTSVNNKAVWRYLGTLTDPTLSVSELRANNVPGDAWAEFKASFGQLRSLKSIGFLTSSFVLIGAGLAGLTLQMLGAYNNDKTLSFAGAILTGVTLFVASVVLPVYQVGLLIIETGLAATKILGASAEVLGSTRIAAAVGLVLQVGVIWGVFIYQVVHDKLQPGTVSFNKLLMTAAAGTIIALAFFILSLSVVGLVLVGIIAFVDALLTILCQAEKRKACFTLTGELVKTISEGYYSGDATLDFNHKDEEGNADLVTIASFNQRLKYPELGYRAGNILSFDAQVKTKIYQKVPADGPIFGYIDRYFDAYALVQSSFEYKLGASAKDYSDARRGDMLGSWRNVSVYKQASGSSFWKGDLDTSVSSNRSHCRPG